MKARQFARRAHETLLVQYSTRAALMLFVCLILVFIPMPAVDSAGMFAATPTATIIPPPDIRDLTVPITVANAKDIQAVFQWKAHIEQVTSLVFIPQTNRFVSTSSNGMNGFPPIIMWEITAESVNRLYKAFEEYAVASANFQQVQLSWDGRFLSAGIGDIWDAPTGKLLARIPQSQATSIAILDDNSSIAGGGNGVIGYWYMGIPYTSIPMGDYRETGILPEGFTFVPNYAQLLNALQMGEAVTQVLYEPAGYQVFVFTADGSLYHYVLIPEGGSTGFSLTAAERSSTEFDNQVAQHVEAVFQPGATRLAYLSQPSEVQIYDYQSHEPVGNFTSSNQIGCIAYSLDGSLLAIGDATGGVVSMLDTKTYSAVETVYTGGFSISSCTFGLGNTVFVTGHADGSMVMWSI